MRKSDLQPMRNLVHHACSTKRDGLNAKSVDKAEKVAFGCRESATMKKKKSEFKISLLFSSGLRKQKIVKSIDSLENNGFGRRESEKERHKRKKGKSKFKYLGSFFL